VTQTDIHPTTVRPQISSAVEGFRSARHFFVIFTFPDAQTFDTAKSGQ